jgi:hypothetical protein
MYYTQPLVLDSTKSLVDKEQQVILSKPYFQSVNFLRVLAQGEL